ncbi:unnamed protein product [Rodentolepis nana]|uniref:G_PROTEIN_RECEP_F1_2 domain-containing protein n=1 Tax=Rodentolepis nana TaxID=102285 RepID=A0A0R3T5Z8_RODNA|nr:unnamed protein product [Rodentolepis nana]
MPEILNDSLDTFPEQSANFSLTESGEEDIVNKLHVAVAALGLVTNSMVVIVLTQLHRSHPIGGGERSARCNLLGLAVADFCICLSSLPLVYSKRVYRRSDVMFYYTLFGPGLASTFLTVSSWMVVLVSILRYLAICWPLKSRFYLRTKSVIYAIIIIYLAAFIFNFPIFFQYDYIVVPDTEYVHIVDRIYPHFFKDIYAVTYTICTNVGPFIAVLVTNISVIVACKKSQIICENFEAAKHRDYTHPPTSSSGSTPNNVPAESSNGNPTCNVFSTSSGSRQRVRIRSHNLRPRALHRVTPLLLAVIFAFLLLSTPFGIIHFICLKLIENIGPQIIKNTQLLQRYHTLNRLLQITNFFQVFACAMNFFLYFVVSQTFRRTTKRTMRRFFQRFRRRRGLKHLCACMYSGCCCKERRPCKNEACIVRVYSPIECRNHHRRRRHVIPMPIYQERNLISPKVELQQ